MLSLITILTLHSASAQPSPSAMIASAGVRGSRVVTQRVTKFANSNDIAPDRLRSHLEFIASDELEGRDTPSRGLDVATLYVATMLKLWGVQPAGDEGTFFQSMTLSQRSIDTTKSAILLGGASFPYGDGFRSANRGASASGKLVYVGHGYMVKKKGIDPYAGLSLKGKILVTAAGLPKGVVQQDLQGKEGEDYATPESSAQRLGAVAVLTIQTPDALKSWNASDPLRLSSFIPDSAHPAAGGIATIAVGPGLAAALFDRERITAAAASAGPEAPEQGFEFEPDKSMQLAVEERREKKYARNVVAIVPGTDPVLKKEYVAFGAHIDHVGTQAQGTGDRTFNGADDDGSGTVAILEIAHALIAGQRPKRSCLFVWHCGEEKGMWGSSHFVNNPTANINVKQIVAQLNVDMIGRSRPMDDKNPANKVLSGPHEIYVVGSGRLSSALKKTSETVNSEFLGLSFNYKYDDPKDPESIYTRSDHYVYAQKGIPIIFYFNGVHVDYHQVTDEVSEIDFTKLTSVARTIYATGLTLANAKSRPVIDTPSKN